MAHSNLPRGAAVKTARPAPYILIVDTDRDRIGRAARECADVLPAQLVIVRNGDDAVRMLTQFGPPALLIAALSLPGRDGLSVIDALRRVDESAGVIAWAADRELREYAACRLGSGHTKVLGPAASPAVLRKCLDSMLHRDDDATDERRGASTDERFVENWSDLAARAQQLLGVAGSAVYAKAGRHAEYRLSVVWTSDAPMPSIPELLPAVLEDIIAGGAARVWPDLANEPTLAVAGSTFYETVRSLAIVPIRRGGETVGALCAFDSKPHALRQSDVDTLDAIAALTSASRPVLRRPVSSPPMDRDAARAIIPRELARVRREQLSMSVVLFAATPRAADGAEPLSPAAPASVGDLLAQAVRGNDLVIRWSDSAVLLVLTGVGGGVARRVAERVRAVVETNAANRVAVSGAVTELQTSDSFEATVARAEERLQTAVQDGRPRIA
jgi:CheY-like chemotaxis protein